MFKEWVQVWRNKSKQPKPNMPSRAVPAIEIDTELANAQYENQNEIDNQQIGGHLDDMVNADLNGQQNMIRIEGEEELMNDFNESSNKQSQAEEEDSQLDEDDDQNQDEDTRQDNFAKGFLKDLSKVGPFSKQILNYSYPPLLYQRGDDSEEEEFQGEGEEMESSQDNDNSYNIDGDDGLDMNDLMGQDLDDIDQNNADLKQQEQVLDNLFPGNDLESPTEIENVDISDIQKMINKSSESPALEEVDHEMLKNMDQVMRQMNINDENPDEDELNFYQNLQRVHNGEGHHGAVGAVIDQLAMDEDMQDIYDDYYDENEMEGSEGLQELLNQQNSAEHDQDFSNLLSGGNDSSP